MNSKRAYALAVPALMKISGFRTLSDAARYRWAVLSRVLAATVGGFMIAGLSVPVITGLLPGPNELATYGAMLLSFTVWLIAVLWVFTASNATRAWAGTTATIIALAMLALLLKP